MAELSKGRNIAAWVIAVLLAALFAGAAGPPKILGAEQAVDGFRQMGYSDGFRLFIGFAETAGGIGLLVPRLATWAAAGLIPIMFGAVYTVVSAGQPGQAAPAVVAGILLAIVAALRRGQALGLAS
jgi:uncharacterized membrane protein YphA (DoxX/SURF4 family)